jgi:hypothetical protein
LGSAIADEPVKYYLYVSDTKLDMLFAQIPSGVRDNLVKEFKFDLKVVAVSVRENPSDETRYSKLKVVTEFLESEGVGGIDDPAAYFKGELEMEWRPFDHLIGSDVVYLAGETETTFVGLGGSAKHVIGAKAREEPGWPPSIAARLIPLLMDVGVDEEDDLEDRKTGGWEYAVAWLARDARQGLTRQNVEFLARRLAYQPPGLADLENKAVLLGSPLYVATAD